MFIHRTTMEHLHICVLNCGHEHGKIRLKQPRQPGNLDMYMLEHVLQNVYRGIVKCAIIMIYRTHVCQKLYVHVYAAEQRREQPAGVLEAKICKAT